MADPQRFLVGVHFRRHFGGPGHVTVAPGEIVLTDRKATTTLRHTGTVVKVLAAMTACGFTIEGP